MELVAIDFWLIVGVDLHAPLPTRVVHVLIELSYKLSGNTWLSRAWISCYRSRSFWSFSIIRFRCLSMNSSNSICCCVNACSSNFWACAFYLPSELRPESTGPLLSFLFRVSWESSLYRSPALIFFFNSVFGLPSF